QSKIGVDSVEYDRWVTQEVVLADTIYRIPLGAIDSIGFQQPEIKFNPKVRWVEKDGYSPYIYSLYGIRTDNPDCHFQHLPANMIPNVGDVFIGLPTDSRADELYYYWNNHDKLGGSWSLVVDRVEIYSESDMVYIDGHMVENISDVFEQYITVEQIYMDENNHIRRRIAGCGEDGLPCHIKQADGNWNKELINLEGTLTREWQPSSKSKIDLSAELAVKYKLRVAYDISWTQFKVKISHDLIIKAKPSIGITGDLWSQEWKLDDWWPVIPKITFPATCPVFETDPTPVPFIRLSGQYGARLSLPAVKMGIGDDVIFDSKQLFPVSYSLHLLPDDEQKIEDDMLNLSGEVKLSGYVQAGILFKANISTASWFKKVLMGNVGLNLYCGPKIGGEVSISQSMLDNNEGIPSYYALSNANINASLLSLDLEAKATAAAFWQDPTEKTFFSQNWSFMCDTVRLAPLFDSTTAVINGENVDLTFHLRPNRVLGHPNVQMCLFRSSFGEEPELEVTDWNIGSAQTAPKELTYTLPLKQIKARNYYVRPIVSIPRFGVYKPWGETSFFPPYTLKMDNNTIHAGAEGKKDSILFTTNAVSEDIYVQSNSAQNFTGYDAVVDEQTGLYKLVYTIRHNHFLFYHIHYEEGDADCPYLLITNRDSKTPITKYINYSQDDNPLTNVHMYSFSGYFKDNEGLTRGVGWHSDSVLTAVRNGDNSITFTGNFTYQSGEDHTIDYQMTLTVQRISEADEYPERFTAEGNFTKVERYVGTSYKGSYERTETTTASFAPIEGTYRDNYHEYLISAPYQTGTYDYVYKLNGEITEEKHTTLYPTQNDRISFYLQVRDPSEQ
ncbi:MAG: hypothetical protein J6T32_02740, partial [Paludibacteraceae bacterium]|nr:hypothetical protein [Paludibacteraceae bacterium]